MAMARQTQGNRESQIFYEKWNEYFCQNVLILLRHEDKKKQPQISILISQKILSLNAGSKTSFVLF